MRKRATVAIVGRPNVGKSTLFNRILGNRAAVVHDVAGVTRDRHSGTAEWSGHAFDIVDTGGLLLHTTDQMERMVRDAARIAIQEADVLLVVADANTGITDLDLEIAREIQQSDKPALLVVNKADDATRATLAAEFYKLGLGEPAPVSAVHGSGVAELLDRMLLHLPERDVPASTAELAIAITGKPNVGKSSLLNALVGEERVLVSDKPGTTRDSIDSRLRWHGHDIDIVDTAGLRKRARQTNAIDIFASIRAVQSIERADVCLLLLDATQPISQQDARVAALVDDAGRGIVVCFNKWDLVEKDTHTEKLRREEFERELVFIRYAPILFISAKTTQRIHKVLETAWQVGETRAQTIATTQLNRALEQAVAKNPPYFYGGGNGRVKYGVQVSTKPPRFALYVNNPAFFHRNYVRYLNNALRATFSLPGTTLRIELRPSPGKSAPEARS